MHKCTRGEQQILLQWSNVSVQCRLSHSDRPVSALFVRPSEQYAHPMERQRLLMTQKMENERVSNPRNSWRNWNSWFGLISYSFLLSQLNTITLNRHTNKLQTASKRKYNNYLLRAGQLVNPNGYIFRLRFDTHSHIYLKEISIYFFPC